MKKKHAKKVGKKILGRAFWAAEIPAAVKYLKRTRQANIKAKPRKASVKHLGVKHKTIKEKAEANIKTRKIVGPSNYYLGFGKGGAVKKVGKEIMSYVGKKVHKKKPVVKKPVTKKSTNPYSLADWKQGIKHKGKGYYKGGFARMLKQAEQHGIIKKNRLCDKGHRRSRIIWFNRRRIKKIKRIQQRRKDQEGNYNHC